MVLSRLDRAVCSHSFLATYSHIACVTLPRSHSDHHPLLISCSAGVSSNPRPFRFQGMWVSHPSFLNLVRSVWSSSIAGSGSGIVVQKLKLLKKALRRWNWELFGDIALNVSNANEKVMLIQGRIGSEDLWHEAMRVVFSTQLKALWRVSIITIFWVVWFLRNQVTFEDGKPIFADALSLIWRSVRGRLPSVWYYEKFNG
ncbi:hypothetical protein Dsin_012751 [Dipteronia sinensis]|uniref:Reverse transcriptase n=1 Tax=Dipteronia sinensis TaxID=43782 RepID=A0AAE0E8C0_9ROSI|nr:hypothetical protein Dsin_012751 [Dipteronia sinensis]